MAPPSTPEVFDFKSEADRLIAVCGLLADFQLDQLVQAVQQAHTLGPIVDPTRYRDALQRDHMDDVATLARLALPVVAQYRKMAEKVGVDL